MVRQYPVHRICLITLVNRALGCSGSDVLHQLSMVVAAGVSSLGEGGDLDGEENCGPLLVPLPPTPLSQVCYVPLQANKLKLLWCIMPVASYMCDGAPGVSSQYLKMHQLPSLHSNVPYSSIVLQCTAVHTAQMHRNLSHRSS